MNSRIEQDFRYHGINLLLFELIEQLHIMRAGSNVIKYFKNGKANDEYPKALDAEVDSFNADENWRLDRMMMLEAIATHEDIGENRRTVKTIRKKMQKNPTSLNEDFADDFDITIEKVHEIMESIQQHPEWDDQQIAMDIIWDD